MSKYNEEKSPIVPIVITAIIAALIMIGLFQVFWYGPLETKYTEAQKQLTEKKAIIADIRALFEKEKMEFRKFKCDTAMDTKNMIEKIKALNEKNSGLSTSIDKIATKWNSFEGNFCNDEIVPETIKWMRGAMEVKKKQ